MIRHRSAHRVLISVLRRSPVPSKQPPFHAGQEIQSAPKPICSRSALTFLQRGFPVPVPLGVVAVRPVSLAHLGAVSRYGASPARSPGGEAAAAPLVVEREGVVVLGREHL